MLSPCEHQPSLKNEVAANSSCKMSEVLSSLDHYKNSQQKIYKAERNQMYLTKVPATLFHILRTEIQQHSWAAARVEIKSSKSEFKPFCESLVESRKHKKKTKVSSTTRRLAQPHIPVRYPKRLLPASDTSCHLKKEEEGSLEYDLKTVRNLSFIPYALLTISTSPALTFPLIEEKCLNGEILCRLLNYTPQYWFIFNPTTPAFPDMDVVLSVSPGDGAVHFKDLKDLQWKLVKGIFKRQKKKHISRGHQACRFERISSKEEKGSSLIFIPLIDIKKTIKGIDSAFAS